jgi:hypothetical protein
MGSSPGVVWLALQIVWLTRTDGWAFGAATAADVVALVVPRYG